MNSSNTLSCGICGGALSRLGLTISVPDRFERHAGIEADGYRREWLICGACDGAQNILPADSVSKLAAMAEGYYHIDFPDTPPVERFATIMALPPDRSDNAGRVARIRSYLHDWLPSARSGKLRALDVGAGLGVFLARFLAEERAGGHSWNAIALEPDPNSAAHLESLDRLEVRRALLTVESDLGYFSLVTLNKVLEHVPDPKALIRAAMRVLNPDDGLLYVEVPDVLTIDRRAPTDNILGALHHHLYSPKALAMVFRAAELIPIALERILEPSGKLTVCGVAATRKAYDARAAALLSLGRADR